MGSLRNPIGPLPSSIYWRRRVVLLSVVAVLALLVTWLVVSVGSGGERDGASGSGGHSPAPSITPGDSPSGPAISEHPGGRDESGEDDESGTGGSGGAGAEGEGSGGDAPGDGESGPGSGSGAGGGGAGSGETTGEQVPAGSTLPNCPASAVEMSLRPTKNTYEPDQKPKLVLKAENTSKADCKVDLGPKTAVLTITETGEDKPLWSSAHCPATGSLLLKLPAQGSVTHTVTWDRRASADKCATPPAGAAGPGTYLAEVEAPVATAKISFVLAKD
ncbi:hypothetical protein [Streptomyces sp. KE1]|uniref:hypothetical protein n=1 Tax=Streptomyces sp. KE1 TaxID=1638939 RepID=UPI000B15072E|nr:hypothetical protein [Streptomyces sp. KE1]